MFPALSLVCLTHSAVDVAPLRTSTFSVLQSFTDARNRAVGNATDATDATDAASASNAASEVAEEAAIAHAGPLALPNEVWGEIAQFSPRRDILNLRATCRDIKTEADATITTLLLNGHEQLAAFMNARAFNGVRILRLVGIYHNGLRDLTEHILLYPRRKLTMDLVACSYSAIEGGLSALLALPLAGLSLSAYADARLFLRLADCSFPLALIGSFSPEDLRAASCMKTLTQLVSHLVTFDDEAASLFSSHEALQSLQIQSGDHFTSRGVESVAQIKTLREFAMQESIYPGIQIDAAAAAALAANMCLERLWLHTSIAPFSEAAIFALSFSQRVRDLTIAIGPGLQHLAAMRSLQRLTLSGRCHERHPIDEQSARGLSHIAKLRSLSVSAAQFEADALPIMLRDTPAEELHLADIPLNTDAVNALLLNEQVSELSLANAQLTTQHKVALSRHPTLIRLSSDHVRYPS